MYKFITWSRGSDYLSVGFDRDRGRRQRELTNNKSITGRYQTRICLKVIFDFAEYQLKATYGLGCKLTLTRNSDSAVLKTNNATNFGKFEFNAIEWYVPHYTCSISQQGILSKQTLSKTPTQLH